MCNLQRLECRVFLGRDRECRAGEIPERTDARGHDVADEAGELVDRHCIQQSILRELRQFHLLFGTECDSGDGQSVLDLLGKIHSTPKAVQFQFGLHRHQHRDVLACFQTRLLKCAVGHFQRQQLLRDQPLLWVRGQFEAQEIHFKGFQPRSLQGGRWSVFSFRSGGGSITFGTLNSKATPARFRKAAESLLSIEEGPLDRSDSVEFSKDAVHSNDGQGGGRWSVVGGRFGGSPFPFGTLELCPSGIFQNQMRVAAPEAKGTHSGTAFRTVVWPVGGFTKNLLGSKGSVFGTVWLLDMDGSRNPTLLKREDHLRHSAHSGGGEHMSKVGFHRADGRDCAGITKERLHRIEFHFVAKRGSGGVAFDVVHRLRINPGTRIGPFKGELLPLGVWTEDELPAPVVRQADSGNQRVDAVAVALGDAESF